MRILLVEDDPTTSRSIELMLTHANLNVYCTDLGEDGIDLAKLYDYDLILLDLNLPDMSGHEVLRQLRLARVETPILILSGVDDTDSKLKGFGFGADDYMTKPFAPEELTARIRALTRRQGEVILEEMAFEDIVLELTSSDLRCGAKRIRLSYKEFEVMKLLLLSQNAIVPKEQLIVKVWGPESEAEDNNVEAYISFLRKKLFFIGSKVGIQTVRKLGYRLGTEAEA